MTKPHTRNRSRSAHRKPKSKPSKNRDNWIWGQHPVLAALNNPSRQAVRLVATRNGRQRLGDFGGQAEDTAPIEIDQLLPAGAVHQGIAAQFTPLAPKAIEEVIEAGAKRVVVLDHVSDPHNLGAIFRSAAAFGFEAILLQTKNAPPISGVAAKSAAGAIELVSECRVVNISRALEHLADAGFHTVGLAGEARNTIEPAVKGAGKLAIVLGAEGAGLRPGVAKTCAELAKIPIGSQMESLNVSNAAAIAFYEAARAMETS